MASKKDVTPNKVLTFFLNDELYAVSIMEIIEVVRPVKLRQIRRAKDYVLGVINYHEMTTIVLDLKDLLSMAAGHRGDNGVWLAVRNRESQVCLCVDRLSGFQRPIPEMMDETPVLARGQQTEYIAYFFKTDTELIPVINIHKLLEDKTKELEELIISV